jgi:hypothetical protein
MTIEKSLFRKEVVPVFMIFVLLIVATILTDLILHLFKLVWIGRYLGISGTIIIVLSFLYSLRKRKIIHIGKPKILLNLHEIMAWLGTLMILVHSGVHFYAILPWLATIAMIIVVISGLTGKYLLGRSQRELMSRMNEYKQKGMSTVQIEKEVFWDAITLDVMKKWRAVHYPITLVFSVLALGHILSIFIYWQWK